MEDVELIDRLYASVAAKEPDEEVIAELRRRGHRVAVSDGVILLDNTFEDSPENHFGVELK